MDYAIIVAGGKGLRMGSDIPKQFLPVAGKPVLMHTLERFQQYAAARMTQNDRPSAEAANTALGIILVLPHEQQPYWQQLCAVHHFAVKHLVVDGGETRFHSSKNGLAAIPDDAQGVVAIHDGVRPFVSLEVISQCFDEARRHKAAIPVLPLTDTLRFIPPYTPVTSTSSPAGCACSDPATTPPQSRPHNVLRSDYRIVQTPQTFDIQLAKQAFRQPYSDTFTDDASVIEALGHPVFMVDGNRENIKLTTPFDLKLASVLTC